MGPVLWTHYNRNFNLELSVSDSTIWSNTLELSNTILEAPFTLIYGVYSKGVTYEDHQFTIVKRLKYRALVLKRALSFVVKARQSKCWEFEMSELIRADTFQFGSASFDPKTFGRMTFSQNVVIADKMTRSWLSRNSSPLTKCQSDNWYQGKSRSASNSNEINLLACCICKNSLRVVSKHVQFSKIIDTETWMNRYAFMQRLKMKLSMIISKT